MFMDFYCILIILTFIPFVVVSEGCKGINQPATTLDGGGCMCRNTDLFYMYDYKSGVYKLLIAELIRSALKCQLGHFDIPKLQEPGNRM